MCAAPIEEPDAEPGVPTELPQQTVSPIAGEASKPATGVDSIAPWDSIKLRSGGVLVQVELVEVHPIALQAGAENQRHELGEYLLEFVNTMNCAALSPGPRRHES